MTCESQHAALLKHCNRVLVAALFTKHKLWHDIKYYVLEILEQNAVSSCYLCKLADDSRWAVMKAAVQLQELEDSSGVPAAASLVSC